ncbi:MAG: alpha/beta hydrolase [Verrucomicrobiales bacterium]|nr:alpha/beta hydrolase [Verrucomicrobiales bacterium]
MISEIKNAQGETLDFNLHNANEGRQVVVIGHGVTGNKDRPFVVALANALEQAGINALRFSFAGNGGSEGRFVDCTISKEVSDLGAVIDALADHEICYVGHSMGGAVGVIRASEDDRIRRLVSLAGMVHTAKFAETEFGMEKPDEGCMWEEESCPLSSTYVNDMNAIDTVVERGAQIKVPWLLVHGTEDDVVPIQESHDIIAKAGDNTKFVELNGANHVFAEEHCEPMCNAVVDWVKGQFG